MLDANENESKQDKNLKEWVELETTKQNIDINTFCEKHLIPNILDFTDFPKFIKERKELQMNKFRDLFK